MIFNGDVRLFHQGSSLTISSRPRRCPWNIWNHPAEFTDTEVISEILGKHALIEVVAHGDLEVTLERFREDSTSHWARLYSIRLSAISGAILGTRQAGTSNGCALDETNSDERFLRYLINSGRCALEFWLSQTINCARAVAPEQLSLFQP